MNTIVIDETFIKKFVADPKKYKSPDYKDNVKLAEGMRIHADGTVPGELLTERRPNESAEIHAYRKKIYKAITKAPFSKIVNVLMRIRQADDWKIMWEKEKPAKIRDGESLQQYCEEDFPKFNSITNWVFNYALKQILVDPNGVIFVFPMNPAAKVDEYSKPYSWIFKSENVIHFEENDSCILLSDMKNDYVEDGASRKGDIYYFIDKTNIYEARQTGAQTFTTELLLNHNIGYLPAMKLGGVIKDVTENGTVYESFLASVLPYWDEAVREYSDLQAEVVLHIHSEKWSFEGQQCVTCNGTGKLRNGQETISCDKCSGHGYASASPYSQIVVRPQDMDKQAAPIPPAGYIQKLVEIVKIQDERVQNHINRGYSAINFDFLCQTQLNQSGTAKELDRQELNSFIYNIAAHLVNLMNDIYFFVSEYRHKTVISSPEKRLALIPKISIPSKFDVLSESYIVEEIKGLKGIVTPILINQLQIEYVSKKFANDPELKAYHEAVLTLDPLPGRSEDDKMVELNNGGITKLDYIISCNIEKFVTKATESDEGFLGLAYEEQYTLMEEYGKVILDANSLKSSVLKSVTDPVAA